MIIFENSYVDVGAFGSVIRGMRNPMNSWTQSDTYFAETTQFAKSMPRYIFKDVEIGPNDLNLMMKLIKAGPSHCKFMRMITGYVDITAPLYWWKEFDTYKIGTVANSCSTMHKIASKKFEWEDFSTEHLFGDGSTAQATMKCVIDTLNEYRELYLISKNKDMWWQLIQLLPSSYNQKRTIMYNYAVLMNIYATRKDHKLDEWHSFCDYIRTLPYSQLITEGN